MVLTFARFFALGVTLMALLDTPLALVEQTLLGS